MKSRVFVSFVNCCAIVIRSESSEFKTFFFKEKNLHTLIYIPATRMNFAARIKTCFPAMVTEHSSAGLAVPYACVQPYHPSGQWWTTVVSALVDITVTRCSPALFQKIIEHARITFRQSFEYPRKFSDDLVLLRSVYCNRFQSHSTISITKEMLEAMLNEIF